MVRIRAVGEAGLVTGLPAGHGDPGVGPRVVVPGPPAPARSGSRSHCDEGVPMSAATEDLEPRVAVLEEQVEAILRQVESLREEIRALAHLAGRGELASAEPR